MCLAVPMRLVFVRDEFLGTAELDGVSYDVNLSLVDEPVVGDFLIVHAGFAIEKLDQDEADARLALFSQMAAGVDDEPDVPR